MKQKMNIWPGMTQHLNMLLQKYRQKHELWPFTKTNHSFISERELKYVKYFIRYYFLSFLLWSINVIVMEICPGRWNPILFVLVVRFNYYTMDNMDHGENKWLDGIFRMQIFFYCTLVLWMKILSTYNLVSGQIENIASLQLQLLSVGPRFYAPLFGIENIWIWE